MFLSASVGREFVDSLSDRASRSATLTVTGTARTSTSGNIVGHVAGQKPDAIVVNTHHDGGWSGAVQDAAGVAVVMGLAAFYSRFPSNYIQKDLYFVIDGSHYAWNYPCGANKFTEMHPGVLERMCLAIGSSTLASGSSGTMEISSTPVR